MDFCVRAKFGEEIKCIVLSEEKINAEEFSKAGMFKPEKTSDFRFKIYYFFIILVIEAFKIKVDHDLMPEMLLSDNLNTPIPEKDFATILKTFHKGSLFFVNVRIEASDIKGAIQMVTPSVIIY